MALRGFWGILFSTVAAAAAECLDAGCAAPEAVVEAAEAAESQDMRTELLQVKLELVPRLEADQLEAKETGNATASVFYGKLLTASPHWCGYIPWLVQFLVPPCWFGKPEHRDETLGPDGLPVWCHDVYAGARAYVKDCAGPGGSLATEGAGKAGAPPDWCKYIPDSQQKYSPDCAKPFLNQEVAAVRQANFDFRPLTSLSIMDVESNESSATYYGKVLSTSPHWCGNVPWIVQFVVPPCWIGKPAASDAAVGPDGKPDWCKWVPNASKSYVADCRGGTVDHVSGAVADPYAQPAAQAPSGSAAPGTANWCKWVPESSKQYVPDCH